MAPGNIGIIHFVNRIYIFIFGVYFFVCVLFISVHSMMISNKGNFKLPDINDSTRRVIYYKRNEYKLISELSPIMMYLKLF